MLSLAAELGLEEQIRWRPLGVGFFHDGRLASMSTPREALDVPRPVADRQGAHGRVRRPLQPHQGPRAARPRADRAVGPPHRRRPPVGAAVPAAARLQVRRRLRRPARRPTCGRGPAARRARATAPGREVMGWIRGGHQALADALADAIRDLGGEVFTSAPVRYIPSRNGRATGVVLDTGVVAPRHGRARRCCGRTSSTCSRPDLEAALPAGPVPLPRASSASSPACARASARTTRSTSPTGRIPITSVVETTHVVDPEHVERPPAVRAALRHLGLAGAATRPTRGHHRGSTSATWRRCSPTSTRSRRDRDPGGARARRRAGPSPRRSRPHHRPVPRARARHGVLGARLPRHRPRTGHPRRR